MILHSLLMKLLDDSMYDFQQDDNNFFGFLEDDEQQLLEEIIDKSILFLELVAPLFLLFIPITMIYVRRRLAGGQTNLNNIRIIDLGQA